MKSVLLRHISHLQINQTSPPKKNTNMKKYTFINRDKDFLNNPNPRISICLCLDTSSSMWGAPIKELNQGVQLFYDAIRQDLVASGVAEIAIVTFGAGGVKCHAEFSGIQNVQNAPVFHAGGMTPMGEAVNMALDKLANRRQQYRRNGVEYYKPWLVLMSDGQNNGSAQAFERARQRVADFCSGGNLDFLPIGVGNAADMAELASFSPQHPPFKMDGLRFREFFSWLSRSVSRVSASTPGRERSIHSIPVESWTSL